MEIFKKPVSITPNLNFDFINTEVLPTAEKIQQRKDNLYLALILGNNYNKLIRINAHTTDGPQLIEGVMLALTDEFAILKAGLKVPVLCIEEIRIY